MYPPLTVADIVVVLNRYDTLIAAASDQAERDRLKNEQERWQAHFDKANLQFCPPPRPEPTEEEIAEQKQRQEYQEYQRGLEAQRRNRLR